MVWPRTNDCTYPQVLKVRLQTQDSHGSSSSSSSTHPSHSSNSATASNAAPKAPATSHASPRVGKSSFSPLPSPAFPFPPPPAPAPKPARTADGTGRLVGPTGSHPPASSSSKPGILSLYRSEGFRFFFAGTAGPILGLAFIDSAFFGLYGRMMSVSRRVRLLSVLLVPDWLTGIMHPARRQAFGQDRQDPNSLSRVALSGAAAGAMCAMLETPVRTPPFSRCNKDLVVLHQETPLTFFCARLASLARRSKSSKRAPRSSPSRARNSARSRSRPRLRARRVCEGSILEG